MKSASHLTPGEFELMEVLWSLGEASVKDIWRKVRQRRNLAYTTVMTVLDKMSRKGFLQQRKEGKAFLYSPAIGPEEVLKDVIQNIIQVYFNGSRNDFQRFVIRGETMNQTEDLNSSRNETPSESANTQDTGGGQSNGPAIDAFLL